MLERAVDTGEGRIARLVVNLGAHEPLTVADKHSPTKEPMYSTDSER